MMKKFFDHSISFCDSLSLLHAVMFAAIRAGYICLIWDTAGLLKPMQPLILTKFTNDLSEIGRRENFL